MTTTCTQQSRRAETWAILFLVIRRNPKRACARIHRDTLPLSIAWRIVNSTQGVLSVDVFSHYTSHAIGLNQALHITNEKAMFRLRFAAALLLLPLATGRVIMFGDSMFSNGAIKDVLETLAGGKVKIENSALVGASFHDG